MAKIAILGFGTVGSGVYEVLCRNAASVSRRAGEPVEVKYILDPKDFTGNPVEPLVVKSIDVILQDPEIRVVVETIGGTRFAYPYVKACLESGRSVCTSNKEMVATYGAELLASGEARSISAATRAVELSRSAFYKDKDCIFDSENGREVITVMATLRDETGALQSLLAGISAAGASIVTINQSTPENGAALVAVTIRTDTMQMSPEELTEKLSRQRMVVGVRCGYNL